MGLADEIVNSAISKMVGNSVANNSIGPRYIIVTRDSKDDKTNYAMSYPARIKIMPNDPVFGKLTLSGGTSAIPMELHLSKVSTHIDWFDDAITQHNFRPAIIYREVADGNFIPVVNGDSYIHFMYHDVPPITMFKNYSNMLRVLQCMLEDTEPNAISENVAIYRKKFGNMTVILEERSYKAVAIRIANSLSEYGDLVLDAIVLGKGKYLITAFDVLSDMFNFKTFTDERLEDISEATINDWLSYMDEQLNRGAVTTNDTLNSIKQECDDIKVMNALLEITKTVYKNNASSSISDFTKALRVELCKYTNPDGTLFDMCTKFMEQYNSSNALPADVIQ